jgi:hypothetical protein
MAGSRGSAGIAGAWYALVSIGKKKYYLYFPYNMYML